MKLRFAFAGFVAGMLVAAPAVAQQGGFGAPSPTTIQQEQQQRRFLAELYSARAQWEMARNRHEKAKEEEVKTRCMFEKANLELLNMMHKALGAAPLSASTALHQSCQGIF